MKQKSVSKQRRLVLGAGLLLALIVVLMFPKWLTMAHKRKLPVILERFQHQTYIILPSDTQVLEGRDLTGRDFHIELVLFVPENTVPNFKKLFDVNENTFQEIDHKQALWELSLILSFDYEIKDVVLWEHVIHGDRGSITILLAYQKDGSCIAFIRYLS